MEDIKNGPQSKSRKSRFPNAVKQIRTKRSTVQPKQGIFRASFSIIETFFFVTEKGQKRFSHFLPFTARLNLVMIIHSILFLLDDKKPRYTFDWQ